MSAIKYNEVYAHAIHIKPVLQADYSAAAGGSPPSAVTPALLCDTASRLMKEQCKKRTSTCAAEQVWCCAQLTVLLHHTWQPQLLATAGAGQATVQAGHNMVGEACLHRMNMRPRRFQYLTASLHSHVSCSLSARSLRTAALNLIS